MMVLEILIKNYIFNMLEHKVKNVLLVEDLHLFGYLIYHNYQNVALILKILRHLDNETFFLENKFYLNQ